MKRISPARTVVSMLVWVSVVTCIAQARAETELVVQMFRAIVYVEPHSGSEVVFTATRIDFDAYVESGLLAPTDSMVTSESADLDVQKDGGSTVIAAPSERELLQLVVRVPRNTSCRFEIVHYGEVYVSDVDADLDINIFRGRVELANVRKAASVVVTRDAEVTIDCASEGSQSPVAASTYNGTIRIRLPADARANIDARSHSGEVRGDVARHFDANAPTIILRNVLGDIEVIRD